MQSHRPFTRQWGWTPTGRPREWFQVFGPGTPPVIYPLTVGTLDRIWRREKQHVPRVPLDGDLRRRVDGCATIRMWGFTFMWRFTVR